MKQLTVPMLLARNIGPKATWAPAAAWVLLPISTMALTDINSAAHVPARLARRSADACREAARRTAWMVRMLMGGAPC